MNIMMIQPASTTIISHIEYIDGFSAFCIVDKDETCVGVTVYNLACGQGVIIGDVVAIPEPNLTQHDIHFKDQVG